MSLTRNCIVAALVFGALGLTSAGEAGQDPPPTRAAAEESADIPSAFDGPPAPQSPDVISRDSSGRTTIRAVRLTAPIRIDGQLDEALYASVPAISDFIQIEPREGSPATQRTDVWLFFDDNRVYVTARCWESDLERMVANEMRRDNGTNYSGSDNVGFLFDTFYDRQNAIVFLFNPIGGRNDGQVTNERQYNGDWNPIYDFAVGRFEGGWTVEFALPFKSFRYRSGRTQIWGFNVIRNNYWKNERSSITRVPAAAGIAGLQRPSLAATVVGLEAPSGSQNLEIKPYAISNLTSDLSATPRILNDADADFGVDVKYGITQSVTADITYNTDFAQVEADERQVNLTRFSLFFPEKREVFLENRGLFEFGGAGGFGAGDTPVLFHSRRIGLNQGRPVPIQIGGRLNGRIGRSSVGLLNIHTDEDAVSRSPETNFSVVRVKRDVLRKSNIGLMLTRRSVREDGIGGNQAYGVDGRLAFFDNLAINTYWARTHTDALQGNETSYRAQLDYAGDRYGVQAEHLMVGDDFNPDVGFVRRNDLRRSFGQVRFSPRPQTITSVRKFSGTGSMAYVENGAGQVETRNWDGEFAVEFQNNDQFSLQYGGTYEFLFEPFRIASGVTIPVGAYEFANVRAGFTFGRQRPAAGNLSLEYGTFYSGHKTALGLSRGRVEITQRISVEPSVSLNWVSLAEGSFDDHLVGSRVTYTMTPRMFTSALLQYHSDSHLMATNVRLRWEYRPGSELFVVYNEQRDTLVPSFPALANRAFIIKFNRLFRF